MSQTIDKLQNPFAQAYADFCSQTQQHQLTVLHQDGVYRHIRVSAPGTGCWSWNITTAPGVLMTYGDIADGYMFSREYDMVDFFSSSGRRESYYSDGAPSIDVRYWAEKLSGGSSRVKKYDPDAFIRELTEHLMEHDELGHEAGVLRDRQIALAQYIHSLRGLSPMESMALFDAYWDAEDVRAAREAGTCGFSFSTSAVDARWALSELWDITSLTDEQLEQLISEHGYHEHADIEIPRRSPANLRSEIISDAKLHAGSEHEAFSWLSEHEDTIGATDTWEWELREYDIHFLFTCYAIELSMRLYRQHTERHGLRDTYVLLREGRVANSPAQPVVDVSFLQHGVPDQAMATEAVAARRIIMATPQARDELGETIRTLTEIVISHGDDAARRDLDEMLEREARVRERAADSRELKEQARLHRTERDAPGAHA